MTTLMRFVNKSGTTSCWHVMGDMGLALCQKKRTKAQSTEIRQVEKLIATFHCEKCVLMHLGATKEFVKKKCHQLNLFE